mmetsp:Transcript_37692/g.92414  ORF Transcript_37692/g.92414 Transcript_37692/m.92414 type:complete len:226 (-) Transcript_37692:306-983(-)
MLDVDSQTRFGHIDHLASSRRNGLVRQPVIVLASPKDKVRHDGVEKARTVGIPRPDIHTPVSVERSGVEYVLADAAIVVCSVGGRSVEALGEVVNVVTSTDDEEVLEVCQDLTHGLDKVVKEENVTVNDNGDELLGVVCAVEHGVEERYAEEVLVDALFDVEAKLACSLVVADLPAEEGDLGFRVEGHPRSNGALVVVLVLADKRLGRGEDLHSKLLRAVGVIAD